MKRGDFFFLPFLFESESMVARMEQLMIHGMNSGRKSQPCGWVATVYSSKKKPKPIFNWLNWIENSMQVKCAAEELTRWQRLIM